MKNIVLFGDSLTYGYGVFKKDSIAALLQEKFKKLAVINSGVNGDTTREALKRLDYDVLSFSPVAVTVLFGSNDCAPSEGCYRTIVEFKSNLNAIIDRIYKKNIGTKVILITPPPVDETVFMPWTTNSRIFNYSEAIREICREKGCILCDFNVYMTQESGGDIKSFLQEDGCHLSESGYMA